MRLQNTLGEEEIKKQKKDRVNGGLSVRARGPQKRFTAKPSFAHELLLQRVTLPNTAAPMGSLES